MASTLALLRRLTTAKVDFVLVGGLAAIAHGSAVVTEDVDVVVRFDELTLRRLFEALSGTNPRERMSPQRPALGDDPLKYVRSRTLDVTTDEGVLDLLGEITGVGGFERVAANAVTVSLDGQTVRVMRLEDLIASKRAMGRPKDLRVAVELEAVLSRRDAS